MIRGWFTLAYQPDKQPKWNEISKDLKSLQSPEIQARALEQLVLLSYSETIPQHLLMPVVQYTATSHNHRVIKLLLMFLENVDTRDSSGKMRPEFILIIDAIRNLLLHPNEYVRGAAIRFLYKINDIEILSQLLTPIITNLTHREEYVRRHASLLIGRLSRDFDCFSSTLADSIIEAFTTESDSRVLTTMLYSSYKCSPHEAANLTINMKQFYTTDMKLSLLKVVPETYLAFPQFRVRLLETVIDFCEDESVSVRVQSAYVLRQISNSTSAINTTATTYCNLLRDLTDENIRAFIVQELIDMIEAHRQEMKSFTLEMAQGTTVTGAIRTRLLEELVDLVTEENSSSLVPLIVSKDRQSLEVLRTLLLRFPSTSTIIAENIGLFISDNDTKVSEPASLLLKDCGIAGARKEAFQFFSNVLETSTDQIILTRAIWSVAEFAQDLDTAVDILTSLIDFTNISNPNTLTTINSDGTYSTKVVNSNNDQTLKGMLKNGNAYLSLSIISSLVRLKMKGADIPNLAKIVETIFNFAGIEKNSKDICNLWLLASNDMSLAKLLIQSCESAFKESQQQIINKKTNSTKPNEMEIIPANIGMQFSSLINVLEPLPVKNKKEIKLPILQLTGLSDSLYVEANCTLRKFDRVYHFTLYNQTKSTLTNILFEFTAIGSVSIMRRNDSIALGPGQNASFDVPVMISSGACGTLFGAVSFDFAGAGGSDHQLLPLAPIEIDPFFCFEPSFVSQTVFREKWSESVWERKVDIHTEKTDLIEFVNEVAKKNKLKILTPMKMMETTAKSASFVAVNLFTRSVFGEEVGINISAKLNKETNKINGFIRVRSHDEKIALLFGKLIQ
ncbi:coatomer subunit beta-1-like [Histomonas meleagridis]|uniref:coatomer subunit beta-1-like n=1 Tax=Histomonas meleagridis TaxID=135588 RepID=UPI003559BFCB|nr:coatomer subunit beta-1-like [Histomonas meleagridis]KAH0802957.1 coatomer subunit beta-1-like [Histomonas meleagridis]